MRFVADRRHPRTRHIRAFRLAVVATLIASSGATAQTKDADDRASGSRAKGPETAPIFVYEFADFECSHCARFAIEVFPRIDSAFVKTGKIRWIFVNLPLPTHPNAWLAHEAALCAGAIADKFWALHDRLFAGQKEWGPAADASPVFTRYARDAGVPADAFAACTTGDRVASLLLQDVIFAATSRVSGTPAFMINNEQTVMGLKSFEEWKLLLEPMIKRARRN
jgi:protein-disulfide isomerase